MWRHWQSLVKSLINKTFQRVSVQSLRHETFVSVGVPYPFWTKCSSLCAVRSYFEVEDWGRSITANLMTFLESFCDDMGSNRDFIQEIVDSLKVITALTFKATFWLLYICTHRCVARNSLRGIPAPMYLVSIVHQQSWCNNFYDTCYAILNRRVNNISASQIFWWST